MASLPIGLQLYSVREDLSKDFYGTVKAVKEMGYDAVELSGLKEEWDPKEIKRMIDEVGLICNSSHCPTDDMEKEGTFARYKEAGCDYIVIPWMSYGSRNQRLQENLDLMYKLAEKANKEGLTMLYHNHDFEFKKVDDKCVLDIIYDTIPENLLKTQIDTCWVNFASYDPCEYLRKYAGRSPLVHIKDYWEAEGNTGVPYDLIGKSREDRENEGFIFKPVGHGIQNVPALLEASKAAGAQMIIVEQDESPERPALESAKMSIDYLRSFEW